MKVHITKLYGIDGTGVRAQQEVLNIAKKVLDAGELGIFRYPMDSDSPEMLRTRLDGIIASVQFGDIVIFQFPTWNGIRFDEAFVNRLESYRIKKIIFVQDVTPLMFEENRNYLSRYIDLYNRADLLILPSRKMADFLKSEGLTVDKIVIQRMWDFPVSVDVGAMPEFNKLIQFAGSVDNVNFAFVKEWNYERVGLAVTAKEGMWAQGKNIEFLGWFHNESLLADRLRKNGGFGLLWTEDRYCGAYMAMNACCKLGTYLGAGLPVIVSRSIPEAETIIRKKLGFAVDTLDEAVEKVEGMTAKRYRQMAEHVASFGTLIREGYFAKKLLIDAVFRLLYE